MEDDNIVFSDDAPPPMMQDADKDGEVCRICRVSVSADDPLRYPCLCRGSIKYMHKACLYQWLSVNHKAFCEVCGHAFSFSPVYADNTPSRIPIYEIVAWGLATDTDDKDPWALLLDYHFTFRDCLVGLLCFVGQNSLRFIYLSLMMYFREPIRQEHRIDVFADEMAEVVAGQFDEIQRQREIVIELLGIEGSIYRFLKHVLKVLAENATMALVLVFLPNYLGRMILYSTITSNLYAIVIGYIPILGLGLIYLGRKEIKGLVGALLSFNMKFLLGTEPLMMGNMGTGRAVLYFWREFLVAISPVMTLLKVAAFLVIKLLVFSFVLGCLLDACTIEIWGISMEDKIEGFCGHPLRSSMYYFVLGLCYMLLALHTSLPILLWDIGHRIPNLDLIRILTREPLSYLSLRLLLSISCDSISVVILIYLPVTLSVRLTPSIFPLELIFPDIIHSILEFAVLLFVYMPFVEDHVRDFNFGDKVGAIKHWVSGVVWAVGLDNFSVAISQGVIGGEGVGNATIGDESIRNENYCREVSLISCKGETLCTFLRWIILMLFLAWNTVLLNTIMLILPVLIGRAVLNAIHGPEELNVIWQNDLYTISTGWYIMWKCIAISIKVAQCIKDCDVLLRSEILEMCSSVLKYLTLNFMWITVVPLLIGLLLDLATAPLMVPMDATQILF
ncbi:RING/FYVE/PHD zinc finger superfamily protein [Rhynchospora pubera]|uniref:RING-type E3 ubiquitin transferase n=1 Tax=Rhynchospora pubera TaxID=906938 RepID=A0AAV8D7J5_9POAL|nr:RING/FYVE/PHD zinc finger superfamily protein [Rhynchospora pubera]